MERFEISSAQAMWGAARRRDAFSAYVIVALLAALAAALLGLVADHRLITGVPAWLKPAKFAMSGAIYTGTALWLMGEITWRPRLMRRMVQVIAAVLALEIVIIFAQAARGQTSHFNVATPLDAGLFAAMGISIAVLWVVTAVVAAGLFRTSFADRAWGWALRWGLVLSLAGSSVGGLMTQPSAAQLAAMEAGEKPVVLGAHTVGGPDGGATLPGIHWSSEHGDLRVPHFLGLHAVQVLPLLIWLLRRRDAATAHVMAASYGALFVILMSQAMAGEPLLAPGPGTVGALLAWAVASAVALGALLLRRAPIPGTAAWGRP